MMEDQMNRIVVAFFLMSGILAAQEDPEIKGLAWHRYVTSNFTILSLEDDQGLWMKNNLEDIKYWCMTRWGFEDIRLSKECRIFCVPDSSMLKKLFDLDSSRVEVRRKDGAIEITAMWISLDDKPARVVPTNLTKVLMAEMGQAQKSALPCWAVSGISMLNGTLQDIRYEISSLSSGKCMPMESLLEMSYDQHDKLSADKKRVFDSQSAAMMLLVRKEFGEVKTHSLIEYASKHGNAKAVRDVLGFRNVQDFEKTFLRFLSGLGGDIKAKVTPDSYLTIKKVGV